jgi:hypothetical protein
MCISTAEGVLVQSNINLILPRAREFRCGGIFDATFHCYKTFMGILQPQKSKRFPSANYTIQLKGIS